ncbi:GNAT family N-acetyltransferase [Peribacillus asahii]|uniref:GNAT family N-acetyltransferase n=1 Tax=Peribacillus asahii TaxID=228899 RepID=UPI002079516F|nr:GNAT family N-acetyltransferase [Peribacillus asahii]USK70657.1 GNAT family N-acetyltransferase [Peribacillus asahii]
MLIRQAVQADAKKAVRLFRDAIKDIAEALTGEKEEERVLAVLADFFTQKGNRLSYENCTLCEIDGSVAGVLLGYDGGDAEKLDEPLAARLRVLKNNPTFKLEKEAKEGDFYIDTLCVDSAFRGKGIGTKLLQVAEQYAKAKGYKRISLAVEEDNKKAQQLYTKIGYKIADRITIHHHQYQYRVKILQ